MRKCVDPEKVLEKAAGILNCDLDYIRHSRRISRSLKEDRDLLVYLVWKVCILSKEEMGQLFGMTYSAISHILGSKRTRIQKDYECELNTTMFIHYARCDTILTLLANTVGKAFVRLYYAWSSSIADFIALNDELRVWYGCGKMWSSLLLTHER